MNEVFNVPAVSWKSLLSIAVAVALPGLIAYVSLRATKNPTALKMALVCSGITLALFLLVCSQLMASGIKLLDDHMKIGGGVYSVSVPYADIHSDRIAFAGDGQALPKLLVRTNGIGLPGIAMGWFHTDKRKVFAVFTGLGNAVYIPTRLDYDILVSPDRARDLVEVLRRHPAAVAK